MNSGLYALAGASATATAAAWANRLLEPMTKVSKVYFGLSRWLAALGPAGPRLRPGRGQLAGAGPAAWAGRATGRGRSAPEPAADCRHAVVRWPRVVTVSSARRGAAGRRSAWSARCVSSCARRGRRARARRGAGASGWVDGDGDPHLAAELGAKRLGEHGAQPVLDLTSRANSFGPAMSTVSPTTATGCAGRRCCAVVGGRRSSRTAAGRRSASGRLVAPRVFAVVTAGVASSVARTVCGAPLGSSPVVPPRVGTVSTGCASDTRVHMRLSHRVWYCGSRRGAPDAETRPAGRSGTGASRS